MKIDVQVCGGPWGLEQSCTPRDVPEATTDGENKLSRPTEGTGQLGQRDSFADLQTGNHIQGYV